MVINFINIKLLLISSFVIAFVLFGNAQNHHPDAGKVFMEEQVSRIDIYLHPDSLAWILAPGNEWSDHEFPASFYFLGGSARDTIHQVGFRLRGNTSRFSGKKSFKVSFNSFYDGRFEGLEKLNLNGEHNDPTVLRSRLFWTMARNWGIPASRINHTRLYINGAYHGLYVNVEHIDEEFVEIRYGNKNGNLYKCLWPADLDYIGSNPDSYKLEVNGRRVYELKTNTDEDDYSDLAHFIGVINLTSTVNLQAELEPIFNVNAFLKYYAFEILTGHWDGYAYNKNNFYLYRNTASGKFEFIPYDGDNTFGIDWIGRDWANRNVNQWANTGEDRPLVKRLLQVPEYRNRLNFYLNELLNTHFHPDLMNAQIDELKNQIAPFISSDTYYSNSYGFDYQDFVNSFTQALGGHVAYGLKNYMAARHQSALSQLDLQNIAPIVEKLEYHAPFAGQFAWVGAQLNDESNNLNLKLHYRINGNDWLWVEMEDEGLTSDFSAQDGFFGIYLETDTSMHQIDFYLEATDPDGALSREPYENHLTVFIREKPFYSISINELCPSNTQLAMDNFGEYDDWLELHNYGDESLFLEHFFLTDQEEVPLKWRLPSTGLAPGAYEICWLDGEPSQGAWHANFRLNQRGETISLYFYDGIDTLLIDQMRFTYLNNNATKGRIPNGVGPFGLLIHPSPGFSNTATVSVSRPVVENNLKLYPNPFVKSCWLDFSEKAEGNLEIFDASGKLIRSEIIHAESWQWNGKDGNGKTLPAGIYPIRFVDKSGKVSTTRIIKMEGF